MQLEQQFKLERQLVWVGALVFGALLGLAATFFAVFQAFRSLV